MTDSWRPPPEAVARALHRAGRRRLGELAIARGFATEAQVREALARQASAPSPIGRLLVEAGALSEARLVQLLDEQDLDRRESSAPAEAAGAAADPARVLKQYVLVEEIGRGGMGLVWRAWDRDLRRWVALKVLREQDSEAVRRRFLVEARAAAGLRHPNLVTVYEAGEGGGRPYIAMELIDGRPLEMNRPLRELAETIWKAAQGLEAAHAAGVVHRDLKPGNIMVDARGEPRVVDFGLAHLLDDAAERITRSGAVVGTPLYMAPEQVQGRSREISPRTDVHALGAILYEAAAGRPPYAGESATEIYGRIMGEDAIPPRRINSAVPVDLETIILKSLDKDPQRRYPSAGAFAADLARFLQGDPISARPVSTIGRIWRKSVKHRSVVIPSTIAVLLGAGWLVMAGVAARRDDARKRAFSRLEEARVWIERIHRRLYDREARYDEVARQVEAVRSDVEQVVRAMPGMPAAHDLLGRLWEIAGMPERAEACWRRAIELDAGFSPARFRLGRLMMRKAILFDASSSPAEQRERRPESSRLAEEAAREIDAALADAPGFSDPFDRELATALRLYRERDLGAMHRVAAAGASRFGAREGTEEFHWLAGVGAARDDQRRWFDEALSRRPRYPLALFSRALLHSRDRDPASAVRDLEDALLVEPRFSQAHFNLGNARMALNETDAAIACYTLAIGIDAGRADPFAARGEALRRKGHLADALRDFDAAIRLNPADPFTWFNRGLAREAAGDLAGALDDTRRAMELLPESPRRAAAQNRIDELTKQLEH